MARGVNNAVSVAATSPSLERRHGERCCSSRSSTPSSLATTPTRCRHASQPADWLDRQLAPA